MWHIPSALARTSLEDTVAGSAAILALDPGRRTALSTGSPFRSSCLAAVAAIVIGNRRVALLLRFGLPDSAAEDAEDDGQDNDPKGPERFLLGIEDILHVA